MDVTKFLSLIENRCLLFPRADRFNDPYEGALSGAGVLQFAKAEPSPDAVLDLLVKSMEVSRRQMFISCWFASEHESAAMWKLYLQSPEGIAIKTDHGYPNNRTRKVTVEHSHYDGQIRCHYDTVPIALGINFLTVCPQAA